MNFENNTSMLSDDLKPRRTPVPASFGESIPRPSVPDLSIIETAPIVTSQPQPSKEQLSQLDHLSYNDWRQKTSGGAHRAGRPTGAANQPSGGLSNVMVNYSPQPSHNIHRDGVSHNRVQPAVEVVSYTDFGKKRPSTAPAARPHQVESHVEHPLAKSAPSPRVYNQHAYSGPTQGPPGSGPSHSAFYSAPPSVSQHLPQVVLPVSHPSPHRQNVQHTEKPHSSCQVPMAENEDCVPDTHLEYRASPRSSMGQAAFKAPVSSKNQMRNRVHFTQSNVPYPNQYGHPVVVNDALSPYHPTMKNIRPYPCHEQVCCPSAAAMITHMHSVPPCAMPNPHASQTSYDDLYKIVLAQNDQLKALQAQVDRLLLSQGTEDHKTEARQAEREEKLPVAKSKKPSKRAVIEEGTQTSDCEARGDGKHKMSIGVMTSIIQVNYRGRVGQMDPVHNSEQYPASASSESDSEQFGSSDDSPSRSSPEPPGSQKDCIKCCQGCSPADRYYDRSGKQSRRNGMLRQRPNQWKKSSKRDLVCLDEYNSNDPGVSAAITAVRGCQAALASKAGVTSHDFSTMNVGNLPPVIEQSVSPNPSIQVNTRDFNSSSCDEYCSSHSEEEDFSQEDESSNHNVEEVGKRSSGPVFYNNVMDQHNRLLDEREPGSSPTTFQTAVTKPIDFSASKRVAFEAQESNEHSPNFKEIAVRYLKENHPEELASNIAKKKTKNLHNHAYNMPVTNMSIATFQYMEKYNLLDGCAPQQCLEATVASKMHEFHASGYDQEHLTGPMLDGQSRKPSRTRSANRNPRSNFPSEHYGERQRQMLPMSRKYPNHQVSRNPHLQNGPSNRILDASRIRSQPIVK